MTMLHIDFRMNGTTNQWMYRSEITLNANFINIFI